MSSRTVLVERRLSTLALALGLGLAEEHAEVLLVLIAHIGQPLTSTQMCCLCNTHRPLRLNVFQERVRFIRSVMGRDAIAGFKTAAEREGRQADGRAGFVPSDYALSPDGLRQCQVAMQRAARQLMSIAGDPPAASTLLRTPSKAAG